ncbi:MAG: aldehyde dehydrogenase family protein [Chthoniobacteraceae bacterium]
MIDEQLVSKLVSEVLLRLQTQNGTAPKVSAPAATQYGVYENMEDAIEAAQRSYLQLHKLSVAGRKKAIDEIRRLCVEKAEEWGTIEFNETKIGRLEHKIAKLQCCGSLVPGVEFLEHQAYSGGDGLTIIDCAPWGVIGAITPSTHSVPTLTGNAINMIAAGNAVVYNTHPNAAKCAAIAIRAYNEAIFKAIGISDLLTTVIKPTLESFDLMTKHPLVRLLCVTGGPAVVRAAMASGKRAICAGPGNPPVVVDETADLNNAAKSIIAGAAFDNNLLCCGEKQVFVVESVADKFIEALRKAGAWQLKPAQIEALTQVAFTTIPAKAGGCSHQVVNKDFIGKDAAVLAKAIGLEVPACTQLLFGETDEAHLFVQEEQMMPFLPIVRVSNVDQGIDAAIRTEHNYRHTAIMHSKDIANLTKMAQEVNTTLFVKNGPSTCGLGLGGEGFLSFSIATPTGEGITTPMTFTRSRRCVMVNSLNMF